MDLEPILRVKREAIERAAMAVPEHTGSRERESKAILANSP